ncbi:MAG TPA: PfkB family carbohydrate kinase, partial [Woeseiaceae bacterium]|nr:PfkB family carbohydrate kinase [Woeseiaceae bacterium]
MTLAIPDFSVARVLVAGDVMLDRYLFGGTSRISPEAPVPVVQVHRSDDRAGGAANVAVNLAALGARTSLLGVVGRDLEAGVLQSL